jgi:hypothetical protein
MKPVMIKSRQKKKEEREKEVLVPFPCFLEEE